MTISHTRPHLRLRFILLAALVAMGAAIATFGVTEAQAHGECTAQATPPAKTAAGNIRSDGTFSCTQSHRFLTLTVGIEKLKGGVWKLVKTGRPSQGTGQGPITGAVVIPCSDTDNYRGVANGFTGRDAAESPHVSKNTSVQSTIACTPNDLANTAALLELALFA
jgi:hypothetical protein